ncbi:ThuA domain-containing protein [Microbacterium protaetiae]|uniref:ThuA domain-containing protein n=1 Tax=Microbacterium protaetiae TaxID=2509458 RepID=A0A4P6EBI0_9MICO|nr:ThuA domain-containing protein [Microbacterium protaetiae]QAY59550.1 ThuA domain-containing protein [Microbacterium protaetiae]
MHALIAVGSGRYADPWHPFAENAAAVAALLEADGWSVTIDDDLDSAMTRLDGVDMLVVSAGNPWGQGERGFGAPAASTEGLDAALARGIGVLGLHAASASLRDYPAWGAALGAVWIPDASMHPPFEDAARVHVLPHELTAGLDDFTLADERYSWQQRIGAVTVLVDHEHDGTRHPLVWIREHGPARIAYDALGHNPRSYEAEEHRELVRRLARWVAREV